MRIMTISDIINSLKQKTRAITEVDESIYEIVAAEVTTKKMRPGIYAKAFADASGDENKAAALYITYRVTQVRKEVSDAIRDTIRCDQPVATESKESMRLRKKYAELDAEEARVAEHEKRIGRRR